MRTKNDLSLETFKLSTVRLLKSQMHNHRKGCNFCGGNNKTTRRLCGHIGTAKKIYVVLNSNIYNKFGKISYSLHVLFP